MRFASPILGVVAVFALSGAALTAAPTHDQTKTVTIRPQQTAGLTNVDNPANALDDNRATFAAISLQRVCRNDDEQPRRGTLTLEQFPAGYLPKRLEVSWTAWAVFAVMQENTAKVTASVEYASGDRWRPLESASWTTSSKNCPMMSDGTLTCLDHAVGADLPAGLDSAHLRVRVTLAAAFTECEASGISGVANLVAHAKVYDVRLIAQKRPRPRKP